MGADPELHKRAEQLVDVYKRQALNDAGLPALDGISLTSTTGPDAAEPFISFQVPIDDRQHLQVTLEVSGNFYEIRTWQTITDTDWESDDSIQLLPID